jgi:hypothetical protein
MIMNLTFPSDPNISPENFMEEIVDSVGSFVAEKLEDAA